MSAEARVMRQDTRKITSFTDLFAWQKDRVHFYDMARASLHEVQGQLLPARDLTYLTTGVFTVPADRSVEVHKILTGLINSIQNGKS